MKNIRYRSIISVYNKRFKLSNTFVLLKKHSVYFMLFPGPAKAAEVDRKADRCYQLSEPNIKTERHRNQHKGHESFYEEM